MTCPATPARCLRQLDFKGCTISCLFRCARGVFGSRLANTGGALVQSLFDMDLRMLLTCLWCSLLMCVCVCVCVWHNVAVGRDLGP